MTDLAAQPAGILTWQDGRLVEQGDACAVDPATIEVADSWLVENGLVLGLALHRERFLRAVPTNLRDSLAAEEFWTAVERTLPAEGDWFPRVELRRTRDRLELRLLLRPAPARTRSVIVATHRGRDPRSTPTVKGPDLAAMLRLRTEAQSLGAGESILTTPEGYLVEGAYSALAWWRGEVLCVPAADLERIDSITAKTVLTLAAALAVPVADEHSTAAEVDGLELWSMSALHGIRIVTGWVDGPQLAERPGRLEQWRRRLESLRRPVI